MVTQYQDAIGHYMSMLRKDRRSLANLKAEDHRVRQLSFSMGLPNRQQPQPNSASQLIKD